MELVVFVLASAMMLIGAVGVITRSNPVHAALSLVLTLFGVAVHFVALEAYFLAAVQIIVYAGAIVVLSTKQRTSVPSHSSPSAGWLELQVWVCSVSWWLPQHGALMSLPRVQEASTLPQKELEGTPTSSSSHAPSSATTWLHSNSPRCCWWLQWWAL
jgi:NADH:ubiquinone oxidoreductase subunit 6 (subunit J)